MSKQILLRNGILVVTEKLKSVLTKHIHRKCLYRKKIWWVQHLIQRRKELDASNTLCRELMLENQCMFQHMLRMNSDEFNKLLTIIDMGRT